jgi:hypothetical protein
MKSTKKHIAKEEGKTPRKKLVKKPEAVKVYKYSGDRRELVDKLRSLYEDKRLTISAIAKAAGVKSSSASCWMRDVSMPTPNRIQSLVDLINSVLGKET